MSAPLAMILIAEDWRHPVCVVEAVDVLTSGGFAVQVGASQEESGEGSPQTRCIVAFGSGGPLPLTVGSLSEAPVGPPLILVRRNSSAEANALALQVHAVLSRGEIVPDLLRVATGALINDVFRNLRELTRVNSTLSRHLWVQRALMFALTDRFTTVQALAARLGCKRATLEGWWRKASQDLELAGAARLPRPKQFLKTICFFRAVAAWLADARPNSPWKPIAEEMGIDPTTMRRLVREVTGKTPSELCLEEVPEVMIRAEEELVRALDAGGAVM